MNEYTYDDLIVNPNKEGIESLIGKEVYFSDVPNICLENANKNDISYFGTLERIRKDGNNPFMVKSILSTTYWSCIIPKKEEPKPKYVPFNNRPEFLNRHFGVNIFDDEKMLKSISMSAMWVKHKNGLMRVVTEVCNKGVVLGCDPLMTEWEELLKCYTFLDGSPCGKLAEED